MPRRTRTPAKLPLQPNLSVQQLANFLDVSDDTIYELVATEIPHHRVGRLIRVAREDFLIWFQQRKKI